MNEQLEQRIEGLELKVDTLTLQVEKLDRLVYTLFKRLPREPRREVPKAEETPA